MDFQTDMFLDASAGENVIGGGVQHPMRVVLIPQTGTMRTIWLPSTVDGRYKFLDRHGSDDGLPFYIEAQDGVWVANSGRSAAFVQTNKITGEHIVMGHELPLTDAMMANLRYNGAKYVLYAEVERPRDHVFIPYYFEDRTDYIIGRQEGSSICYPNKLVSREHAILRWKDGAWEIVDQNSSNGVYVNGRRVKQAPLRVGDCVFIMGLYILVGSGFLSLNNANGRVTMNTPKIRRIGDRRDVYYPEIPGGGENALFDRQPRKLTKVDPAPIEIDMPPMPLSANKIPLLLRMGNPLLMGGQALMTGNIFMAMTSMVLPSMTQGLTEKDRKEYEAKRLERYREYLVAKRDEIRKEKETEERLLAQNDPDLNSVMRFAITKDRLWERRKGDSDFLDIRIGYGQIPLLAKRTYTPRKFQMEQDVLVEEMYDIAEQPVVLEDAPVLLSLKTDHVVGVLGETRAAVELFRNMMMQIAVTHSYDEVKLVLLAEREELMRLNFVRYLPHCWNEDRSVRFFAGSQSDAQQLSKYLSQEFQDMLDNHSNNRNYLKHKASYVVMVLSKKLFDCVEILKEVLDSEDYCGVSVITALDSLPKECSKIIDLRGQNKVIDLNHCETDDQRFTMDQCDQGAARTGLRQLMQTKLKLDSELYTLPSMITFLELYKAGRVEHLNPLKRWTDNDPVKSLAAPVGVGTDGGIFTLDLHEKRQGPHGLVAGMTGSGKSEFIITYILSMAVNYSPDEVAFILIDYKGGGLADAFEDKARGIHLPHLVGTITNLDGAAIQRSLMSINSELKRRQAVFKKAKSETNEGTMDIYDYQRLYRNKKIQEPMPHLFIISDEFAELKKQQPEFMDELISAARIGRSLGVHLILATQKPSGVVNDQIWSNTKFRVCLRVQDRGDSMEMLKRPEAAELKNTGRFYLQVGYNEFFALGQSAWCGAGYAPQAEVQVKEDHSARFIDNIGQTVLEARPKVKRSEAESKQIVAVVQYLSDLAKREGIEPKSLWMEPLPDNLELRTLMGASRPPENYGISALLGTVDDPERQEQFPLYIDVQGFHSMLLCGSGGSGKSTLLSTLLYTLVSAYSPEKLNYYILDLSGGVLSPFGRMPHCGAYLTENNESDFDRLLSMLQDMVAERKKLYAQADVYSYDAYIQVRPLPLALMIIDGYTNINSFKNGNEFFTTMHEYIREGTNYGIRFLFTCNHLNEISNRCQQEIDYRIALQAKDKYEYGDILNAKCQLTPPVKRGRGLCVVGGRPLEYHVAITDCEADGQARTTLLRKSLEEIAGRYAGVEPARSLPMADSEQEYASFCADIPLERIPLGYSVQDMKKVAVPFQQLYGMSLYFGNPLGIRPVLLNLIHEAQRERMDLIVMRRQADTIFDGALERSIRLEHTAKFTLLNTTAEDLARLDDLMIEEITARNIYRDMYCEQNGIPGTDKGRAKKAAKFIRSHTRPVLVLFESFGDLCRLEKSGELVGEFSAFLGRLKGYNIYFCGCFYPDEEGRLSGDPLMENFNKEELLLLFGGRYDRQCMTSLPMDLRGFEQINPKYDRFMLKYQGKYHPMIMPCGKLDAGKDDPDEAPII